MQKDGATSRFQNGTSAVTVVIIIRCGRVEYDPVPAVTATVLKGKDIGGTAANVPPVAEIALTGR